MLWKSHLHFQQKDGSAWSWPVLPSRHWETVKPLHPISNLLLDLYREFRAYLCSDTYCISFGSLVLQRRICCDYSSHQLRNSLVQPWMVYHSVNNQTDFKDIPPNCSTIWISDIQVLKVFWRVLVTKIIIEIDCIDLNRFINFCQRPILPKLMRFCTTWASERIIHQWNKLMDYINPARALAKV